MDLCNISGLERRSVPSVQFMSELGSASAMALELGRLGEGISYGPTMKFQHVAALLSSFLLVLLPLCYRFNWSNHVATYSDYSIPKNGVVLDQLPMFCS